MIDSENGIGYYGVIGIRQFFISEKCIETILLYLLEEDEEGGEQEEEAVEEEARRA